MMPQQRSRKRGVILTEQGLQKLQTAKSEAESDEKLDKRYTREQLGIRTGLDPDTVAKVFACEIGVDKQTLKSCFRAFNLQLDPDDYQLAYPNLPSRQERQTIQNPFPTAHDEAKIQNCTDWGEAPDVSLFFGRTAELDTLKQWILAPVSPEQPVPCRLITLLGVAGMGKTWLSVKLAQQLQDQFEFVLWRSLHSPIPPKDILADIISVLSHGQAIDLPERIAGRISCLIQYLQRYRCLLIFDKADYALKHCFNETPACQDCPWFPHKSDAQAYCDLIKRISETAHQSCVILTSREKPKEIIPLEGNTSPVRVFHLNGLTVSEVEHLFHTKGTFQALPETWNKLVTTYSGNPLALSLVSTTIQALFSGQISEFLQQQTPVFGEVSSLVKEQLHCLPEPTKDLLKTLAVHSKPVSFAELRSHLKQTSAQTLLEALQSLQERSLLEIRSSRFTLQPLVLEYIQTRSLQKQATAAQEQNSQANQLRLVK